MSNDAFDGMPLPNELVNRGWISEGRMQYSRGAVRILFDTSSQFEVFRLGQRLGAFYARTPAEFLGILNGLIPEDF